jgi:hypothetical protein
MIGIGNLQISYSSCGVKDLQLGFCPDNQLRGNSRILISLEDGFSHFVFEGLYQMRLTASKTRHQVILYMIRRQLTHNLLVCQREKLPDQGVAPRKEGGERPFRDRASVCRLSTARKSPVDRIFPNSLDVILMFSYKDL